MGSLIRGLPENPFLEFPSVFASRWSPTVGFTVLRSFGRSRMATYRNGAEIAQGGCMRRFSCSPGPRTTFATSNGFPSHSGAQFGGSPLAVVGGSIPPPFHPPSCGFASSAPPTRATRSLIRSPAAERLAKCRAKWAGLPSWSKLIPISAPALERIHPQGFKRDKRTWAKCVNMDGINSPVEMRQRLKILQPQSVRLDKCNRMQSVTMDARKSIVYGQLTTHGRTPRPAD